MSIYHNPPKQPWWDRILDSINPERVFIRNLKRYSDQLEQDVKRLADENVRLREELAAMILEEANRK